MDSPKPSQLRRRAIGVSLLMLLAVAGGVIVGVRYQREKVVTAGTGSAEPRVSALIFVPTQMNMIDRQTENNEEFRNTQAELLRSRLILNDAFRRPEIAELSIVRAQKDPVEWLAAALRIDFPSPELLRVGLDGDATEEMRVLVDAVVAAYLQRVAHKGTAEREERLRRLEQYAAEMKESLRKLRDDVRAFHKEQALEARMKTANSPQADLAQIQFEVAQQEKLLASVVNEIVRLKVERDAPPRVELMEAASVRGAK